MDIPKKAITRMNQPTQPSGGPYALELLNISVHYGGVVALDGADIGVREGEVVAVMGLNGAGKSLRKLWASGGLALVQERGAEIHPAPLARRSRRDDIANMLWRGQAETLLPMLNESRMKICLDFTRTFGEDRSSKWWNNPLPEGGHLGAESGCISALFNHAGGGRGHSLNEKRRMYPPAIGGAMAMNARICLFAEPFAGLFPQMLERVKTTIRQMRDDGRTIIFISHNMDIARELSDRATALDSGELLASGEAG